MHNNDALIELRTTKSPIQTAAFCKSLLLRFTNNKKPAAVGPFVRNIHPYVSWFESQPREHPTRSPCGTY